mmetsp:Transcript_26652/g.58018  ORF Transcript_26652/g.58018 Transcript_26652/m.58018 type:complete len:230 (+) Transcript_26652:365-1054(+)|eukprot:CAMPEP_0118931826 /NCGR_PEP_ID=MMETSP1169-20130426/8029_1 /TAXON_ID=36882 /ORGANISM="Pyramimonas obovata, Strain CCMP722" /LENGTH=229 /DNA_ID=CAMNT_0006874375 /DNA_START=365 /DNA_END=1054 /DNA_ORIENTATION=+
MDESSEDEEDAQLQYKVIILGDGAVGKTSLANRFTEDLFSKSYKQTIGVNFFIKQLTLSNGVNVSIQLWDIGGQTIGGKMIGNYIYGAQAVLLVYDISNYQSFANLEDWFALVKRTFDSDYMPYVALVANKADLTHLQTVKPHLHREFADTNQMHSFFMSAKTGDNVEAAFDRIVADLAGVGKPTSVDHSVASASIETSSLSPAVLSKPTETVTARPTSKGSGSKCVIL